MRDAPEDLLTEAIGELQDALELVKSKDTKSAKPLVVKASNTLDEVVKSLGGKGTNPETLPTTGQGAQSPDSAP